MSTPKTLVKERFPTAISMYREDYNKDLGKMVTTFTIAIAEEVGSGAIKDFILGRGNTAGEAWVDALYRIQVG